jgi:hypothetical protein
MSSYVKQPGDDKASFQGVIEPVAGAATYTTAWIDAKIACNFLAFISAGAVTGSVNAKIEQATDSSGTGAKDITGLAITALTAAAGSALINVVQGDLDITNDFNHIRLSITTANAADVAGGALIALDAQYEPLAQGSKIDEVVS